MRAVRTGGSGPGGCALVFSFTPNFLAFAISEARVRRSALATSWEVRPRLAASTRNAISSGEYGGPRSPSFFHVAGSARRRGRSRWRVRSVVQS